MSRRFPNLFYGWWIVFTSAVLLTLMSLTVFQGLGTVLVSLERQYGWSRTALSGAFSMARVEGAILGPIEGVLVDRVGTRRMVLIGFILMGIGFVWLSQVDNLIEFYAAFMTISLGSGLGGWLAIVAMVNNWFDKRRSFAMSIAMSGIHLGGLLVPVFAFSIERLDFSITTIGVGLILLVVVGPATLIIRSKPEDMGLLPDGKPENETVSENGEVIDLLETESDFTVMQALKTPAFWILTVTQISSSVSIVTLALHLVPKLTDMGMTLSSAGTVVLAYTVVALPAQSIAGYLAERLPKILMISIFLFLQGAGIALIAVFDNVIAAYMFALLYGIGFGGRTPLITAIRGDYFGRKAFATIMGVSQFPMNLAMIVAPLFAGYMFDTTGTYIVPFMTFSVLCIFGSGLILFVRKPQKTLS
ncbi:MAG: MFS transporter [Dehalococcoidia bacterium]|nr:MFS transporter [Chloroflexota bacterium]MBR97432.1 MFS transporter [Dehalococcoidia bacterium]